MRDIIYRIREVIYNVLDIDNGVSEVVYLVIQVCY